MQTPSIKTAPARSPRRRAQASKAFSKTFIKVQVDSSLKRDADGLFAHLGFDTQTAVRIFLTRAVHSGGLPFEVSDLPYNQETLDALVESERLSRDPNAKSYTDVDEMFKEILADV